MAPFGIPRPGLGSAGFVSARIFRCFMPGDGFLSPGSDFWIWGQHVGPGTFLGSKMGPEKSEFATETFCGGNSGEFP